MTQGIPALMIPGMACNEGVFSSVLDAMRDHCEQDVHPRVVDVTQGSTVGELALHALSGAPERFVLVGFSLGGYVALDIALTSPDRLVGLVIISASARADPPSLADTRSETERRVETGALREVARATAEIAVGDQVDRRDEVVTSVVDMMTAVGPNVFLQHSSAVRTRMDRRAELAQLSVPLLVLTGRDDKVVPSSLAVELADAVSQGRSETFAGAGHMLPLERPHEIAGCIADFLSMCRPNPPRGDRG